MKKIVIDILLVFYWTVQRLCYLIHNKKNRGAFSEYIPKGNSLILIPHADDEWIGCSQIIRNYSAEGFYCNLFGNNYSSENQTTRNNELVELSKALNFKVTFSGGQKELLKEELTEFLLNNHFREIFVPSYIDWHEEHIAVNYILREALLDILKLDQSYDLPYIVLYQVSVPFPDNFAILYNKMSIRDQKYKWNIFRKFYKSQLHIPYKRFIEQELLNGGLCNIYSSEVYARQEFHKWSNNLNVVRTIMNDLYILRDEINNIKKIREHVNSLSRNYF